MKQPEHKGINLIGNKAYPMRYALLLSNFTSYKIHKKKSSFCESII